MRLRLARKIEKRNNWGWKFGVHWIPYYSYETKDVAKRRIRKYENNGPKGIIMRDSLRLVRYIIDNRKNKKEIYKRWVKLKVRIRRDWNPEVWSNKTYEQGISDWKPHPRLVEDTEPDYSDPTVRLEYDISYYSDRWCDRRVALIDRTIDQMLES